jgi:hypothetical protein
VLFYFTKENMSKIGVINSYFRNLFIIKKKHLFVVLCLLLALIQEGNVFQTEPDIPAVEPCSSGYNPTNSISG